VIDIPCSWKSIFNQFFRRRQLLSIFDTDRGIVTFLNLSSFFFFEKRKRKLFKYIYYITYHAIVVTAELILHSAFILLNWACKSFFPRFFYSWIYSFIVELSKIKWFYITHKTLSLSQMKFLICHWKGDTYYDISFRLWERFEVKNFMCVYT